MEGLATEINGLKQIQNGMNGHKLKKYEIVGIVLGLFLFSATVYASYLSIKTNKLTLRKLKDEGYY